MHGRREQRLGTAIGHHGIQDQTRHSRRVLDGVPLGNVRAVGDTVDRHRRRSQRLAQVIKVRDCVRRAEELTVRTERDGTPFDGSHHGHGEIARAQFLLQLGTLQGAGSGAALIEHDDAVSRLQRCQPGGERSGVRHTRLTRAAGEQQQNPSARPRRGLDRHPQRQRAGRTVRPVQRHLQRRAGEGGCVRTRRGARELGSRSRRRRRELRSRARARRRGDRCGPGAGR